MVYQFDQPHGSVIGQPSGLIEASDVNLYGHANANVGLARVIFQLTPTTGILNGFYMLPDGGGPIGSLLQAGDGHLYGAMLGGTNGAGYLFGLAMNLPLPKPHLGNFIPLSGKPGQLVAITGQNLIGTTDVKCNGIITGFKVASPNVVYTVVPNGATSGSLSLMTAAGTTISTKGFTVVP